MVEVENLLNSLYMILEESHSSNLIDSAVDFIANKGKRISLIEVIQVIEDGLDNQWRIQQLAQLVQTTTLVHSKYSAGRITQNFEEDIGLKRGFILDGSTALSEADTAYNRYLYYDEFKERLKVLKEHIVSGTLDEFLALSPEEVIHEVMGFSGKLLKLVGIDPLSGETYRRFREQCELLPVRSSGIGTLAESLQKAFVNIQKTGEKPDDDVAIGTPLRESQNVDIAEGVPVGTFSKNNQEKKLVLKARRFTISSSLKRDKTTKVNNSDNEKKGKNEE